MTNVLTDSERLALINAELPKGCKTLIARKLGVTSTAVAYVLSGQRNSPKIAYGIFAWYLDWLANQPAPIDKVALDAALLARQNPAVK